MPYTSTDPNHEHVPNVQYRTAERKAVCRFCEKDIKKGDFMLTWFTNCSRGHYIHLHPHCAKEIGTIVECVEYGQYREFLEGKKK